MNLKPFFARTPRFWGVVFALLATAEAWLQFWSIFSSSVFPEFITAHSSLWSLLVAVPVALAASYLIQSELTDSHAWSKDIVADIWMVRSLKLFAVYFAVVAGWAATLVAFGSRSPFGAEIMRGISGPELPLDEKYWPLVFLAGVALALFIARTVANQIREEAND